ncbi:Glutathione S-transferase/chloride channel C-terminal [Penicillium brevicompactum]|uniref:glutathione transferase n=1 Tax=Penicillium brevicompactum TaxID=5074 RepID=A0A9W9U9Z7_PENBR|nr:Glutathione S-transferase/chloride channel C-terminal [Penicillium brevicompactum]
MSTPDDVQTRPAIPDDKLVLYVKKASPTSTANTVKPLMLIEALGIPHHIHLITSTSNETWFHSVNPYKMVPAMEDSVEIESDSSTERTNVFDSSACLTFLAEKYDTEGLYRGKNLHERTIIMNWLMSYTAGLGATGKIWLLMKAPKPVPIGESLSVLLKYIRTEYDFLESRLSEPGQLYVALADRPTIADFAIYPLANEKIAISAELDFTQWPKLKAWSEQMSSFKPVARALHRVSRFGLSDEELAQLDIDEKSR